MKIPDTVWTAGATLLIFLASLIFGADQVGAIASAAVTVALALLKAWQVQQPADAQSVGTRSVNWTEQPSKMKQWLLG